MDLLLTDEQRLLQDSAAKMLAQAGGVKRARSLRGMSDGYDRQMLARMGEEGWLGLLVPEERGGSGLGLIEFALVLMEAGRALAPEPIGAAAVVARSLAFSFGSKQGEALFRGVLEGTTVVMPAMALGDATGVRWNVPSKEAGVRLGGTVTGIPLAASCDGFLVGAQALDDGFSVGEEDAMVACVPRATAGVSVSARRTVDGRSLGDLALSNVAPMSIAPKSETGRSICNLLLFAQAAELVGVMTAAIDITTEYLKTRKQFGKPIGSFQALQHRIVNDYARMVSARSFVFQVAAQGIEISSSMASALKAYATTEALEVTKSAIQMHGGIGFTEDCDIGLYLKRAMWHSAWLGNAADHRARYAELMG